MPDPYPRLELPDSLVGVPLILPLPFPGREDWIASRGFSATEAARLDPRECGMLLRLASEFDADRLAAGENGLAVAPFARTCQVLSRISEEEAGERGLSPAPTGPPRVMAILNVTPDSFSDGGDHFDPERATERALEFLEAGAAIVDVGGESTRPGAAPVDPDEESRRVVPVVERIARARPDARISIDTRHSVVAERAAEAGARIVNDVTGLTHDPEIAGVAARRGLSLVLGHIRGTPATMQNDPSYDDVVGEVADALAASVERALRAGVPRERIHVDPGLGFAKNADHNVLLLRSLPVFRSLAAGVCVGASRKRFLGALTGRENPKERTAASVAAALAAAARGASIVRVHDVRETLDALRVAAAMES